MANSLEILLCLLSHCWKVGDGQYEMQEKDVLEGVPLLLMTRVRVSPWKEVTEAH